MKAALFCVVFALAFCGAVFGKSICEPPHVTWFNLLNDTIDVPIDQGVIMVDYTVDDDSYVTHVEFDIHNVAHPNDFTSLRGHIATGQTVNGSAVYRATGSLPAGTARDAWQVMDVYINDRFFNELDLSHEQVWKGIPHGNLDVVVNTIDEHFDPNITEWTIDNPTFDVSAVESVTKILKFHIVADLSGFAGLTMTYDNDNKSIDQSLYLVFSAETPGLKRVSGTPQDGEYEVPVTIEKGFAPGRYSFYGFGHLHDYLGRDNNIEIDELKEVGGLTYFDVVGPTDTDLPSLQSLSFSPKRINSSEEDQTVTITVSVSDDYHIRHVMLWLEYTRLVDEKSQFGDFTQIVINNQTATCAAGHVCTDTSVVWEYKYIVPKYMPSTFIRIARALVTDYGMNIRKLSTDDLKLAHLDYQFEAFSDPACPTHPNDSGSSSNVGKIGMYVGIGLAGAIAIGIVIYCCMSKKSTEDVNVNTPFHGLSDSASATV
eukprot:TRINITY_DN8807_c0_g1_i1.p1 TRINITY_DN8807_c0_g1~~TRINITY_DN8807_c0_g1_i1.p1  ORF type:complete len:486 (+),score=110.30 TRINITY_DN8807_c0_g1_i1:19-1476(+)